jgi:hypothetical protein
MFSYTTIAGSKHVWLAIFDKCFTYKQYLAPILNFPDQILKWEFKHQTMARILNITHNYIVKTS